MSAFVTATPLCVSARFRPHRLGPKRARSCSVATPLSHRRHVMLASKPASKDASSTSSSDAVASWQEELRMLFDPAMPTGAKQVLVQDLAKRAPEIFSDSCRNISCKDLGLEGIADVIHQFQQDLLPDLVSNGPRYVAKAAEELPKTMSRMSENSQTMRAGMPTSMSPEDVQREFRNIFNRTPEGLFTPEYKILAKFEGYEIRQYPTLIIAETKMMPETASSTGPTEVENASAMGQSFTNLAGFLFGKNEEKTAMKMTTPVILSKGQPEETMSFIIGEYDSLEKVPSSLDDNVTLREQPGQIYAVSEFVGFVTQGEASRQREKLLKMLSRDTIELAPDGESTYKCMIYNGPSTLPNLRRNDMMIEVIYSAEEEAAS